MGRAQEPVERAPKSLYRPENQVFLGMLRELRQRHGFTQVALAERLGRSQNYVTSAERGVIRLDGLQIRDWCHACGADLVQWATEIERALGGQEKGRRKGPK